MELHQLRYFVAVAEVGSFVGAARRCRIAQPSLSQQIRKLEMELGHELFDRLGRRIAITPAGESLLPRARRILAEVGDVQAGLSDDAQLGRGSVSVGAVPTIAPFLLPSAVETYQQKWPESKLTIVEAQEETLLESVVTAKLDLALMSAPVELESADARTLIEEPLVLNVPTDSPLAEREQIELADLNGLPTIFLDRAHNLGQQVHDYYRVMRITPRVVCHASQLSTALRLVAAGFGVCWAPSMVAAGAQDPGIRTVELNGEPPRRLIVAVTRKGRSHRPLVNRFLSCIDPSASRRTTTSS